MFPCSIINCGGQSFALFLTVEDTVIEHVPCSVIKCGGQSYRMYSFALLLTVEDKVTEHIPLLYY